MPFRMHLRFPYTWPRLPVQARYLSGKDTIISVTLWLQLFWLAAWLAGPRLAVGLAFIPVVAVSDACLLLIICTAIASLPPLLCQGTTFENGVDMFAHCLTT